MELLSGRRRGRRSASASSGIHGRGRPADDGLREHGDVQVRRRCTRGRRPAPRRPACPALAARFVCTSSRALPQTPAPHRPEKSPWRGSPPNSRSMCGTHSRMVCWRAARRQVRSSPRLGSPRRLARLASPRAERMVSRPPVALLAARCAIHSRAFLLLTHNTACVLRRPRPLPAAQQAMVTQSTMERVMTPRTPTRRNFGETAQLSVSGGGGAAAAARAVCPPASRISLTHARCVCAMRTRLRTYPTPTWGCSATQRSPRCARSRAPPSQSGSRQAWLEAPLERLDSAHALSVSFLPSTVRPEH
jgi:hypothetical protein